MMNLINDAIKKLNQELVNRCIVYGAPNEPDQYNQHAVLEGVYSWGFIVISYCDVVDPVMTFYDWEYQSIVSIDVNDDTKYSLHNGLLTIEEKFFCTDVVRTYSVNLNNGAHVHLNDIQAIGYVPSLRFNDKRFYALKDGRIYFKKDGEDLVLCECGLTIDDFVHDGFKIIEPENYGANINVLNDMMCRL